MSEQAQPSEPTKTPAVAPAAPPASIAAAAAPSSPAEEQRKGKRGRQEPPPKAAEAAGGPAATEGPPKEPEKPGAEAWQKLRALEQKARRDREALDTRARELEARTKAAEAALQTSALLERAQKGDAEAVDQLVERLGGNRFYDAVTQRRLNAPKHDKVAAVAARLEALEVETKRREQESQQRAESERLAAEAEYFAHIARAEPERYPLTVGEIDDDPTYPRRIVASLLEQSRESGQALTRGEAVAATEAYLADQTRRRYARLSPKAESAEPAEPPKNGHARPRDETGRFAGGDGPRRLTNGLSAERSASPAPPRTGRMTQFERDREERDRLRRAAAAFQPRKR